MSPTVVITLVSYDLATNFVRIVSIWGNVKHLTRYQRKFGFLNSFSGFISRRRWSSVSMINLRRHYHLTHVSATKWFAFIFLASHLMKVERGELSAIELAVGSQTAFAVIKEMNGGSWELPCSFASPPNVSRRGLWSLLCHQGRVALLTL